MKFDGWASIYLDTGVEAPALDRATIRRDGLRTTIVAGPEIVARAIKATGGPGGRVPGGSVTCGMGSVHTLSTLLPSTNFFNDRKETT